MPVEKVHPLLGEARSAGPHFRKPLPLVSPLHFAINRTDPSSSLLPPSLRSSTPWSSTPS